MHQDLACECHCDHCKEIERQKDRMESWQTRRIKFNRFIEDKAVEVKPELGL
tara:strand:+ start:14601 stop:14756 length:156 start_codon:yes stop_codon:yes gene_type:complete